MSLSGSDPSGPASQRFKLVPRTEGDPPLPEPIERALRAQGIDTSRFTLASTGGPNTLGAALATMPASGKRLRHAFRFDTLNGAFVAVERLIDDDLPVTITKASDGWIVVFDRAVDPTGDDAAQHASFAAKIAPLGGEDRGFIRETVDRQVTTKPR